MTLPRAWFIQKMMHKTIMHNTLYTNVINLHRETANYAALLCNE